jgi:uncharacterized alpha-E superfamily protein
MLLSRVAETVYWMARYIERTENTARIIMVNSNLLLDLPKGIAPGWEPILAIMGCAESFHEYYQEVNERNVAKFLIADKRYEGSIITSLSQARENMRTSRVIIPQGAWETLNDLYYFAKDNVSQGLTRGGRYEYLKQIIRRIQMLNGSISGSMSHDQTYDFLRIGRNLERADMTTRVLDVRASNLLPKQVEDLKPFEDIQWKSVLESIAAYQMYRRHVHVRVKGAAVLSYLLQDLQFPRSVQYCMAALEGCLRGLPSHDAPLRILGRAQRMVRLANEEVLVMDRLSDYINELQILLANVSEQLTITYFEAERPREEKENLAEERGDAAA